MKVEKKNGGFILTTEDIEDDSPEHEFIDFLTGVIKKVKRDMRKDPHLWVTEYYFEGRGWQPSVFTHRVREDARKEARLERRVPTRVRKYTGVIS